MAYCVPLKRFDNDGAEIFLGVVHAHDEVGAEERVEGASSVYSGPFGVARIRDMQITYIN